MSENFNPELLTTGNFTIQANAPNGKTITMSGYIYSNNTEEDISRQIDIYHNVIDRQRTKAEIPELEVKLELKIRNLHQLKDSILNLKNRRDSGKKLSAAENKMIEDLSVNIKVIEKDIDDGIEAIAAAKKKVGIV